jgi:adenylylsulfate kinase
MLIAMAGLPGTGKSTLAARLAEHLGAVILNKDTVRAALFPPPVLDYSEAENDLAMTAVYAAAAYIRKTYPRQPVILDGRTFLRAYQVRDLLALAASLREPPFVIECVCADEVVRARLEADLARGEHPAKNRTYDLYLAVKATAEPLPLPRLVLDTGRLSVEACVERALAYLGREPPDQARKGK